MSKSLISCSMLTRHKECRKYDFVAEFWTVLDFEGFPLILSIFLHFYSFIKGINSFLGDFEPEKLLEIRSWVYNILIYNLTFNIIMLNEFLKEASYAELKREAENRKEWRIWKPRTCLVAEH